MSSAANMKPAGPGPRATALLDPGDRAFWFGLSVVSLSLISALATYAILTGLTPIPPRGDVVFATLMINVILIVAMITTIAWQGAGLFRAWREKIPGARLHIRIVALFSVVAALPAILLAVAATTTFSRSLDGWFSNKTREIINTSGEVARAYLDVHGQLINTDILNMARDIDQAAAMGLIADDGLKTILLAQTTLRGLDASYVIDKDGNSVVSAFETDKNSHFLKPPLDAIEKAEAGQVPILDTSTAARVYALAKLSTMPGRYLYVSRELSPTVVAQIRRTEQNEDEYNRLRKVSKNLKIAHGLLYSMISLTAMLAAIWAGLWFAARFVAPIRRLIEAAEQVRAGNLLVSLPEKRGEGDLRRLSGTFNRMTRELKGQRDTLVAVNEQLVDRRRFIEAVLSGVSAGVIGLDADGRVTLVSRAAEKLLSVTASELAGRKLQDVFPELASLALGDAEPGLKPKTQDQIKLDIGGEERTFAVQVTRERANQGDVGSVVTFDDVTDLVTAQRTSAWADVARRIAHEIKNPLTPIQLAAERIKRKYGKEITSDRETFDKLTDTISNRVGDIKTMVDEFAAFARVPHAQMERADLREPVQESVILFRESHTGITFDLDIPKTAVLGDVDKRLLTQAVTNLVKNATEAIEGLTLSPEKPENYRGRIETRLVRLPDRAVIEVIDNGIGLPKQNRAKLLEPYVTTRAKGTGLGLAIVQKIVEQHKGTIELDDAPPAPDRPRGARMRVSLPMPLIEIAPATEASAPQAPQQTERGMPVAQPSEAAGSECAVAATIEPAIVPFLVEAPASGMSSEEAGASHEAQEPPNEPPKHDTKPNPVPVVSARLLKNSDRVRPVTSIRSTAAKQR